MESIPGEWNPFAIFFLAVCGERPEENPTTTATAKKQKKSILIYLRNDKKVGNRANGPKKREKDAEKRETTRKIIANKENRLKIRFKSSFKSFKLIPVNLINLKLTKQFNINEPKCLLTVQSSCTQNFW